ncbi:hypothetical protein [Hankyongella ginsenosidimutans]|nr:hypothetical protein [Hankyongella ginsenosidimutans]
MEQAARIWHPFAALHHMTVLNQPSGRRVVLAWRATLMLEIPYAARLP